MTRPRPTFGCPSMGSVCEDFNTTGAPCRYCGAETVPVFPCATERCEGWTTTPGQECVECLDVMTAEAMRLR